MNKSTAFLGVLVTFLFVLVAHGVSVGFLSHVQHEWNDSHNKALRILGNSNYIAAAEAQQAKQVESALSKIVSGEKVYTEVCQACHQAGGTGLTGAFPPLAGSEWVAKDSRVLSRIVLGGLQGPIEVKGVQYNAAMPAFSQLSDAEIAAVLTYVRSHFGNKETPVEPSVVQDVRANGGVKSGSWDARNVLEL
jgi:mono/diheme cytochrome c family protein